MGLPVLVQINIKHDFPSANNKLLHVIYFMPLGRCCVCANRIIEFLMMSGKLKVKGDEKLGMVLIWSNAKSDNE